MARELLKVEDLKVWFPVRKGLFKSIGYVRAVDGVSLELKEGETLAVVGESGSGKTTLGRTTIGLIKPTSGNVFFDGVDVADLKAKEELLDFRRRTAIIFQDPFSSLNPAFTVYRILEEPLIVHGYKKREKRNEMISQALKLVKLQPVDLFARKYPHMLSGGQRQRVAIARSLILEPKYIVADEPVSMLDASVRVEILYLMRELQERLGVSFLYITHDIATAKYFSEHIAIMYAGKIVELGRTKEVLKNPMHPYTRALMEALPDPDPRNRFRLMKIVKGEPPSLLDPPPGCRFHPRCPYAKEICRREEPELKDMGGEHMVACHFTGELRWDG